MTNVPKVSAVIPLYNKGPYIARALNSVLAQTFRDFEVIVVDDGSTDNGAEVVRSFIDPRIRLIQQENRGVSVARNRGIEAARADLVAFLDSDDEWLPKYIETIMKMRESFPNAGAYATAIILVKKGVVKRPRYRSLPASDWEGVISDYFRSQILGDSIICSSSVTIPSKVLREMKGFVNAKWGEDLDLWARIALKYPIAFNTSNCALIHTTNDTIDTILSRVSITKEHPFIKSVDIYFKYNNIPKNEYLLLYIDKILVNSAILNVIIGHCNDSKEIIGKSKSKWFFITRLCICIWYIIYGSTHNKNDKIQYYHLLARLSSIQAIELRLISIIMDHKRFR